MFDFLKFKEEIEFFLVLDIGTETIKALLFKKDKGKIIILGSSLQYFDQFSVFDSQDFELDVIKKAILKALEGVSSEFGPAMSKRVKAVFIGLPANILKGRVVSQIFKREKPKKIIDEKEERTIFQKVLEKAKKDISQIYSQDSGILAQDIQFINLRILEIKIDGYRVSVLRRYEGENLDFRILAIFSVGTYLKKIENICQAMNFKQKKIFHEVEGLTFYFKEIPEGIFLDLGGEISQIFLLKAGKLEGIFEFEIGGRAFSQALSERLGLKEQDSRIFKERYSKKELSQESLERIKEILHFPSQTWFKNLKLKLKEISYGRLLPSNIYLFGGGSQLPEIKEILKKGDWEDLSFVKKPEVKFLYPKDFENIEDKTKRLNSPQDVPSLLLCYAKKDF